MASKLTWTRYAADYVLRQKCGPYRKKTYTKRINVSNDEASERLASLLCGDKPFAAGRMGLFEAAVMRMYEFKKKNKYALTMDNLYNCAGFFPNDIDLGDEFNRVTKDALSQMDILAANKQLCENYFINTCGAPDLVVAENLGLFDVCMIKHSWSHALAGKKVLVVTSFPKSVEQQYVKREKLFVGTDILPEFASLETYQALMTVGDLRDERFATWFEALDFMKREILARDFDVCLLGCGAYGFPLAAEIKKAGRQAIHMGGSLQILFGIMGKRWDGTREGGELHIREDIAPYYNENWTYPIEEKPTEASKVEYGPYWK
ncbi:MAG: hypothetical protein MJ105_00960 [Lachnospiraceae bacterium]|nr:hypothetical protein [Lachnospiraceae bacterium]